MRVRQIVQSANFNRFQREGLSATQFMTLNLLPSTGEGIMLTELARRLNLSPATVNKTVQSLESRGLVERARSEQDARRLELHATKSGSRLQNAASTEFHRFMADLFRKMSAEQRRGLVAGLEALAAGSAAIAPTRRDAAAAPASRSARESGRR